MLEAGDPLAGVAPFTGEAFDLGRLDAAASRVSGHPGFDRALKIFCDNVIESFEGDWLANRLMGDAGRFALMAMVFILEHRRQAGEDPVGATAARLAEFLALRKLASSNFTHAAIAYMRMSGALVHVEPVTDRRARPLRPGPALVSQARRWLASNLRGIAAMTALPSPDEIVEREGFAEAYFVRMGWPYFDRGFILYDGFPAVEALMQRYGGYVLMLELTRGARIEAPGRIVADAPFGEISERLRISRSQVRSVIEMAEARGWLSAEGKGGRALRLDPAFHELCRAWVAREIAWGADLARAAYAASLPPPTGEG